MGFGEWLQAERERQGFTLEQVEEETKIRRFYIDALEKDRFDVLPPKVYATGFVKKYGMFLGLDEQLLVEEFQRQAYANQPDEDDEQPIPTRPQPERSYKPKNVIAGIAFLVVVILLGSYLVPMIVNHSKDAKTVPVPQQEKQNAVKPPVTKTPTAEADALDLVIETQEDCWMQVVVDGEKKLEATEPKDKRFEFKGKEKIFLRVGNAGGITITLNGQEVKPLAGKGQVAEKEFTL